MSFIKHARVESIGTAEFASGSLKKVASKSGKISVYLDGARKLDIQAILDKSAEKYDLSRNPHDYLYEVVRACTAGVPNENNDCFEREELLRFDARIGMPVYATFVGKPHHLNHKTDVEVAARGIILDAHYNMDAPALEHCPQCNHKTAEAVDRDSSGLNCRRCGAVVKSEFVEILLGIDTVKDRPFAEGVRTGSLNATSMGCSCESTSCEVCGNVARSTREFCAHIRGAAKGAMWMKHANGAWRRITRQEASNELQRRRMRYVGRTFTRVAVQGLEIKRGFEKCHGVEFDEQSRVTRPADPEALQIDVLHAPSMPRAANIQTSHLELESEVMGLTARLEQIEARLERRAMKFVVVRVNKDPSDTHAAATLAEALEMAMPDEGSAVESCEVEADDAGAARLMFDESACKPVDKGGDVQMVIPDGVKVQMTGPDGQPMAAPQDPNAVPPAPAAPGVPPSMPGAPQDKQMTPEEMGVMPPPAAAVKADEMNKQSKIWAQAYKSDYVVDVEASGTALLSHVHPLSREETPIFSVTAGRALPSQAEQNEFGLELAGQLLEQGIVGMAMARSAKFHERAAGVLDEQAFDFKGGRPAMSAIADDIKTDAPSHPPEKADQIGASEVKLSDTSAPGGKVPSSTIESRVDEMADGMGAVKPSSLSTLSDAGEDTAVKRKEPKDKDGASAGAEFDHKMAALETRYQKLASARLARVEAEYKAKIAELESALKDADTRAMERAARAMKIASCRAARNIEESPLKAELFDVLTAERVVGRDAAAQTEIVYPAMTGRLAEHLISAAWAAGAEAEVDRTIARAAEIAKHSDQYLDDVETDLSKQAGASAPELTSQVELGRLAPAPSVRASDLRRQLSAGNLLITPAAPADDDGGDADGMRTSVRDAVGSFRISQRVRRIGN